MHRHRGGSGMCSGELAWGAIYSEAQVRARHTFCLQHCGCDCEASVLSAQAAEGRMTRGRAREAQVPLDVVCWDEPAPLLCPCLQGQECDSHGTLCVTRFFQATSAPGDDLGPGGRPRCVLGIWQAALSLRVGGGSPSGVAAQLPCLGVPTRCVWLQWHRFCRADSPLPL